jgi:hypothetical protein
LCLVDELRAMLAPRMRLIERISTTSQSSQMKRLILLALLILIASGLSTTGLPAPPPANSSASAVALTGADAQRIQSVVPPPTAQVLGFAMADFGGDSKPDLAAVESGQSDVRLADYRIAIRLTEGGRQSLRVTAPQGGLFITAKDVTGDGKLDLLISVPSTGDLVGVFVNDGKGHFKRANAKDFPKNQRYKLPSSFFSARGSYAGVNFATSESQAFDRPASRNVLRLVNDHSLVSEQDSAASSILLFSSKGRAPPHLA